MSLRVASATREGAEIQSNVLFNYGISYSNNDIYKTNEGWTFEVSTSPKQLLGGLISFYSNRLKIRHPNMRFRKANGQSTLPAMAKCLAVNKIQSMKREAFGRQQLAEKTVHAIGSMPDPLENANNSFYGAKPSACFCE
jgi:hypothetical protein